MKRFVSIAIILLAGFSCRATAETRDIKDQGLFSVNIEGRENAADGRNAHRENTLLIKPETFITGRPEIVTFDDENFSCTLYARSFAQGNAVYAEFIFGDSFNGTDRAEFVFNGDKIPLTRTAWGYRGFAAIHPEQKPGKVKAVFTYTSAGIQKTAGTDVAVRDIKYPVSKKLLDLGKFSDISYIKDPEKRRYIKECEDLRAEAFKSESEDSILNTLAYPRNFHRITGNYWNKRTYAKYKYKRVGKSKKKKRVRVAGRVSFHRGVDLKGEVGAPVYAVADGVVVLSHKMFYEGNMIVVDHGSRIFSYYMHMDSRIAQKGDRVKAGQQIGRVGSTGTSTGPHLHLAFCIRGVHVDPLSLFWLPVSR